MIECVPDAMTCFRWSLWQPSRSQQVSLKQHYVTILSENNLRIIMMVHWHVVEEWCLCQSHAAPRFCWQYITWVVSGISWEKYVKHYSTKSRNIDYVSETRSYFNGEKGFPSNVLSPLCQVSWWTDAHKIFNWKLASYQDLRAFLAYAIIHDRK